MDRGPEARGDVAISIATYQRPELLNRLLTSLESMGSSTPFRVIVVDNDELGSGHPAVLGSNLRLTYVVEESPGIVAARNRGLSLLTESDWAVVFVDDDEYVTPGWLDELVKAQEEYGAPIVTGPVLTDFPASTPSWIVAGGFIQRLRHPTGTYAGTPATNNTLLLTSALKDLRDPWFDDRFSVTGGSDTELFTRLRNSGKVPVWCDEAVVHEEAPTSRLTLRWVTRRMVRGGNVDGRIKLLKAGRLPVMAGAIARVGYGTARLIASVLMGRGFRSADYVYVCRGLGMAGAATGRLIQEYRRPTDVGGTASGPA